MAPMNNYMLAVVSGSGLVNLVITLIVVGLVYWVLDWALGRIALPEPFSKIARVILILAVAVFIVNALLSLIGHGFISW